MYDGRPLDPVKGDRGEDVREWFGKEGCLRSIYNIIVAPFASLNHVEYCDNYFTSGPLVDMLHSWYHQKGVFQIR